MITSLTGLLHLIVACIALGSGTWVITRTKGDQTHKRVGYVYVTAMLVLLVTSFMIYRLHGTFGILHWLAVISSVTLISGMVPVLLRKPANYLAYHFSFMYWSVVGLYCAFAAEILTRLPLLLNIEGDAATIFYSLVGVATGLVGVTGALFFRKHKVRWLMLVENWKSR